MSQNRISPFVKRMRVNGGTIYTFSSAVEDIGLNINERNNIVKISNFALLNIPSIREVQDPANLKPNYFNVQAIAGAWEYEQNSASIKDGRVLIAESFQNYALNLETNLLNRDDYNQTLPQTVSERVLWKWLKETGSIRWTKDASNYWVEELDVDASAGYNSIVKYVGEVIAGNIRSDTFGTYNETYILIPTSHGETRVYFKQVEDDNYFHGLSIGDLGENILGRENYTLPHPDGLSYRAYYDFVDSSTMVGSYNTSYDPSTGSYNPGWWYSYYNIDPGAIYNDNAYLIDSSLYLDTSVWNTDLEYDDSGNGFAFRRSNIDCLQIEFDLNNLKTAYADPALTFDKMAIEYSTNDAFDFNAALIYYSVYNEAQDTILATNLLGIMFLDAPSGNSSNIPFTGIELPSIEKIMSTATGFGTSFSLRLNIKTDNMMDDTQATIVDLATSDQLYAEDWNEAFTALSQSLNILAQQNANMQFITGQYINITNNQTQILNKIDSIQNQVNDINSDIQGEPGTIAMFADGDDPLVESSIYMSFGKVGIGTNDPQFPFQIDVSTKATDIYIENAIRDTGGNVLLGYGSPLRLGSSTNYREVEIYTGDNQPFFRIDTSGNILLNSDTSIFGNLNVQGSILENGAPISCSISRWNLNGIDIYNNNTGFVGINQTSPAYQLDVSGNLNIDGSIYQNGVLFVGGGGPKTSFWDSSGDDIYNNNTGLVGINKSNPSYQLDIDGSLNVDGSIFQNGQLFSSYWTGIGSGSLYYNNGAIILGDNTSPGSIGLLRMAQDGEDSGIGFLDSGSGGSSFRIFRDTDNRGYITRGTGKGNAAIIDTNGDFTFTDDVSVNIQLRVGSTAVIRGNATFSSNLILAGGTTLRPVTGGFGSIEIDGNPTGSYEGYSIGGQAVFMTNGTNAGIYNDVNNEWIIQGTFNGATRLYFDGTERLATGNGFVDISGDLRVDNGSNSSPSVTFNSDTDTGFFRQASNTIGVATGGAEDFRFTSNGTFHADADVIAFSSTISDKRLKTKIEPLNNSIKIINSLNGIKYEYNSKPGEKHFGFIAQDVEKILPELVHEHTLLKEGDKKYKTLRQEEIIPHLVEGMKTQQKEINELKSTIDELKELIIKLSERK